MKKIIILFIINIIVSTSIIAQGFWPGFYRANELLSSPSAKASGMGETGVSQVHEKSFYFNPGSLGLFALENKISVSGFFKDAIYMDNLGFYNSSIAIPLQKSDKESTKFLFTIGGYYSVTKILEPIQETTRDFPNGTGIFFTPTYKNYNSTFAVGYNNSIQIGIGLTLKQLYDKLTNYSHEKTSFDFGIIVRYPIFPDLSDYKEKLYFIPSFGYSINNQEILPNLTTDGFNIVLPERKSVGISFESGLIRKFYFEADRKLISLLPSFDMSKVDNNNWLKKYGLELGVMEILSFRIGYIEEDGNTNGFSVNSQGLFAFFQKDNSYKLSRTGLNKFFTDVVSIEYSYANSELMKSYHEVVVTYAL